MTFRAIVPHGAPPGRNGSPVDCGACSARPPMPACGECFRAACKESLCEALDAVGVVTETGIPVGLRPLRFARGFFGFASE
jgi:hypothetical protein